MPPRNAAGAAGVRRPCKPIKSTSASPRKSSTPSRPGPEPLPSACPGTTGGRALHVPPTSPPAGPIAVSTFCYCGPRPRPGAIHQGGGLLTGNGPLPGPRFAKVRRPPQSSFGRPQLAHPHVLMTMRTLVPAQAASLLEVTSFSTKTKSTAPSPSRNVFSTRPRP